MAERSGILAMAKRARALQSRVENMKEDAERKAEVALSAVATIGTAGGIAVLRARLNDPSTDEDPLALSGVPMDLVGGIVMHGIAAFDGFGKYSNVGHAVGNGLISSWAVVKGLELGEEMRQEAETSGTRGHIASARNRIPLQPRNVIPKASDIRQQVAPNQ